MMHSFFLNWGYLVVWFKSWVFVFSSFMQKRQFETSQTEQECNHNISLCLYCFATFFSQTHKLFLKFKQKKTWCDGVWISEFNYHRCLQFYFSIFSLVLVLIDKIHVYIRHSRQCLTSFPSTLKFPKYIPLHGIFSTLLSCLLSNMVFRADPGFWWRLIVIFVSHAHKGSCQKQHVFKQFFILFRGSTHHSKYPWICPRFHKYYMRK